MPRWTPRRWFRRGAWVAALHRVANAAGVHAPRRDDSVVERALKKRGKWFRRPDVVHLSEVSGVDVAAIGDRLGYDVVQFGKRGDAAAGVALAFRRKTTELIGKPTLKWASEAVAGEVRARPIITQDVSVRGSESYSAVGTHAPPDRTQQAQADYLEDYTDADGVLGGDHNEMPDEMRDTYVRTYRGIGVLGLLIPRRFKASKARAVKKVGDHLGVDVVVRLPRAGR